MTSRRTSKRSREARRNTQKSSKNSAETSKQSQNTQKNTQNTSTVAQSVEDKSTAKEFFEFQTKKKELCSSKTPAAERWKALKAPYPLPGSQHRGIFIPPNAPEGKFYIGLGTVVEVGLNARGGIYVWVVPNAKNDRKCSRLHRFFDPDTEQPIPRKYLPARRRIFTAERKPNPWQGLRTDLFWTVKGYEADWDKDYEEWKKPAKLGDEARGYYWCFTHRRYEGVGRVSRVVGVCDRFVDPIPGKVGGVMNRFYYDQDDRFFEARESVYEVHYMDLPRWVKTDATTTAGKPDEKNNHDAARQEPPRSAASKNSLMAYMFAEGNYRETILPELGSRDYGAYLAPDGKWYFGFGKVVAIGMRYSDWGYTLVEPIGGKEGHDHEFFHPISGEPMPRFSVDVTTAMRWPWRAHFTRTLSELNPKYEDAV
ncbi:hypothetical protein ASPCAL02810 [Aspergillus calidoustus]|uniref:Uncharacterized protein n=1 Tax=Aspergillus calidoustus TaxID=454130 RepID=A0A0U5CNE2_ASPCI|nr:hypothetical protein ASPCAL02810 [Aspergillus calidoustus]